MSKPASKASKPGAKKPVVKRAATKSAAHSSKTVNWGTEAAKTIAKFRRVWDKEGVKLG